MKKRGGMGGFQRGVFVRGVRAPVAIINFAFFARDLLIESYINSEIFTGARTTPIIEIPPPLHKTPPLQTPEVMGSFGKGSLQNFSANFRKCLQTFRIISAPFTDTRNAFVFPFVLFAFANFRPISANLPQENPSLTTP